MAGTHSIASFDALFTDDDIIRIDESARQHARARRLALTVCARDFRQVAELTTDPELFAESWRAVSDYLHHAARLAELAVEAERRLRLVAQTRRARLVSPHVVQYAQREG